MREKLLKRIDSILPLYAVFPLLSCVVFNFIIYGGVEKIVGNSKHYDLTLPFDRALPVLPVFVSIYLGCYVFWIFNYFLIARQGKEYFIRFATGDLLSRVVCCIIFLVLPTTNVRPVLSGDSIWITLLEMVYRMDGPTRLFPSIHCLVSWFCYIGIRGKKNVPKGYQIFSCIFALLVCVSTQFTKQHYIVDVIGGILLAEGTYWVAFHTQIYQYPKRLFDWLYGVFFAEKGEAKGKRDSCGE